MRVRSLVFFGFGALCGLPVLLCAEVMCQGNVCFQAIVGYCGTHGGDQRLVVWFPLLPGLLAPALGLCGSRGEAVYQACLQRARASTPAAPLSRGERVTVTLAWGALAIGLLLLVLVGGLGLEGRSLSSLARALPSRGLLAARTQLLLATFMGGSMASLVVRRRGDAGDPWRWSFADALVLATLGTLFMEVLGMWALQQLIHHVAP